MGNPFHPPKHFSDDIPENKLVRSLENEWKKLKLKLF